MLPHDMTPASVQCGACRHQFPATALFCPNCGTAKVRPDASDELLGKVLAERFLIQERIGQGTSGTIYRGEHVTLRRKVAIKVLHHELSRDDLAVERFRREATSVAELDNEHIVEIHDFGRTSDGRLYLAMELLEGVTLDAVLARDGRLSFERAADILIQVGEALMEAHAIGYVHRDLRPRNIFLSVRRGKANFIKLLDFGLSKLVEGDAQAASTSLGMTFGDPRYMSPEAARGDRIDRRADIYQLGCIAYEMLTGAPPFVGAKVFDVLSKQVTEAPAPLPSRRPDTPLWMEAAVARMLAKRPEDRFATTSRMVEALRRGLDSGEVMDDDVARRRESIPPPSVSRVMQKLGVSAEVRRGDTPRVLPRAEIVDSAPVVTSPAPAAAPVAAGVVSAGVVVAPSGGVVVAPSGGVAEVPSGGAVPAPMLDAATAPTVPTTGGLDEHGVSTSQRLARRGRSTSGPHHLSDSAHRNRVDDGSRPHRLSDSASLSASWFADGEDELRESGERSRRIRRPSLSGSTGQIHYEDEPRRRRVGLIVAGILGAVGLAAAAVLIVRSGDDRPAGGTGSGSAVAMVSADAAPAPLPLADAAMAAADAAPAPTVGPTSVGGGTDGGSRVRPGGGGTTGGGTSGGGGGTTGDEDPLLGRRPGGGGTTGGGTTGGGGGTTGGGTTGGGTTGGGTKPGGDPKGPSGGDLVDPYGDGPGSGTKPVDSGGPVDPYGASTGGGGGGPAAGGADALASEGTRELRSGNLTRASSLFRQALEQDKNNVEAITGNGEIAVQQGLYPAGIRELKTAARLAPRSTRVQVLLGEAYLNSGNSSAAATAFKRALQLDPDNARARNGFNEASSRL